MEGHISLSLRLSAELNNLVILKQIFKKKILLYAFPSDFLLMPQKTFEGKLKRCPTTAAPHAFSLRKPHGSAAASFKASSCERGAAVSAPGARPAGWFRSGRSSGRLCLR